MIFVQNNSINLTNTLGLIKKPTITRHLSLHELKVVPLFNMSFMSNSKIILSLEAGSDLHQSQISFVIPKKLL